MHLLIGFFTMKFVLYTIQKTAERRRANEFSNVLTLR